MSARSHPMVTWGNSPEDALAITGRVPDPAAAPSAERREAMLRAIRYMGLEPGQALTDLKIDRAFIGSCTNGRIEDLESAAAVVRGRKVAAGVEAWVVPGSTPVKREAEARGLDQVFKRSGLPVARSGLLDVPGNQRRYRGRRAAMRVQYQPQLRRASGAGLTHPPDEPCDGRGSGRERQVG